MPLCQRDQVVTGVGGLPRLLFEVRIDCGLQAAAEDAGDRTCLTDCRLVRGDAKWFQRRGRIGLWTDVEHVHASSREPTTVLHLDPVVVDRDFNASPVCLDDVNRPRRHQPEWKLDGQLDVDQLRVPVQLVTRNPRSGEG